MHAELRKKFSEAVTGARYAVLIWAAVVVGLGVRLYHFLRDPSIWQDEAILVLNVLDLDFAGLWGKLEHAEAAPPLFLWIEKAATECLGEGTYTLRLFPFLCSCAALLLLLPVARRLLSPRSVPWALWLFACSDSLLWHACEAKPYGVDALAAVLVPALYLGTRSWRLGCRLALFALTAPVAIFLSYPGCFLHGGLLVALLPDVWRSLFPEATDARPRRCWGPLFGYGLLVLAVFAAFTILLLGPIHSQRNQTQLEFWGETFPHWDRPWTVPWWALRQTVLVVDYCLRPVGGTLILLAAAGVVVFWKRRQRAELALLAIPITLALAAACGRAYPYEGSRLMVYATPALVLFIAAGIPPILRWLRRLVRSRRAEDELSCERKSAWVFRALRIFSYPGRGVLYACLLLPIGLTLYRVAVPWDRPDYAAAAAHVLAHRRPADAVIGNDCFESLYYFRHLDGGFMPTSPASPTRLWVVVMGTKNAAERLRMAEALSPKNCQTLERREFERVTVLLRSQKSEVRSQKTENGNQNSTDGNLSVISDQH